MLQVDVNLRKNKFLNIKKSPLLLKDCTDPQKLDLKT